MKSGRKKITQYYVPFVSAFLFDVTVAMTSECVSVHADNGHASKMDQLKIRTLLAIFENKIR